MGLAACKPHLCMGLTGCKPHLFMGLAACEPDLSMGLAAGEGLSTLPALGLSLCQAKNTAPHPSGNFSQEFI